MTEMDSLCECFNLTQHQLGKIMKMRPFQLAQWQAGEKRPNIINLFRLMIFLLKSYHRHCRRELIAKEYSWEKTKRLSASSSAFNASSEGSTTATKMTSTNSINTTIDDIEPKINTFAKQAIEINIPVKTEQGTEEIDKTQ